MKIIYWNRSFEIPKDFCILNYTKTVWFEICKYIFGERKRKTIFTEYYLHDNKGIQNFFSSYLFFYHFDDFLQSKKIAPCKWRVTCWLVFFSLLLLTETKIDGEYNCIVTNWLNALSVAKIRQVENDIREIYAYVIMG